MNRAERLWSMSQRVPLYRLGDWRAVDDLYDHLNAARFGDLLPARVGKTFQVNVGASRMRPTGRDLQGRVTSELLGQWTPAPLHGFESRRGWGDISLYGGAYGDTLLHEMIHQALDTVNLRNGHGAEFQAVARDVGYRVTSDDLVAAAGERGRAAARPACWRRR